MIERRLERGEVLFAEGEPSELVGRILSGALEVVRRADGREIVLARLGAGEHVGEMGVLEGRPRAATVRALEPTRLVLLGREAFLEQLGRDPALAHRLLVSLSERLHRADLALAATPPAPAAAPTSALRLYAASPELATSLPREGLAIERLPFTVGRRPEGDEDAPGRAVDLLLGDSRPYRLSRIHFAIERAGEGVAVIDATSTLGTLVDGTALGEPFARSRLVLGRGRHELVAGGLGSPFAFELVVD